MECPGPDLKSYLITQPEKPMAMMSVNQWAEQIIDALMLIHSMFDGCVHGDLRLENVLLDSSNLHNIKLSNISLRRQLTIELGSNCDTSLHLPPEAIRNRIYNVSSEIYCLGIMLWEMWHGKEAFEEQKGQELNVFLSRVEEGHRPPPTDLKTQTSVGWTELVSRCWANTVERSSLADCKSKIAEILANQKSSSMFSPH